MAIGGYKFRGFHYPARTATAGSDAEKAIFLDWFKCRLAAFKASCDASGALWHVLDGYAMGGAYTSDAWGSSDCVYVLDDTGCNFGAFFQYGTEDKYMAMVSLNSYKGIANSVGGRWRFQYSSAQFWQDNGNDFISLDSTPITPDNVNTKPTGRLAMRSVQCNLSTNGYVASRVVSTQGDIQTGFCTKDADIIEFYKDGAYVLHWHACSPVAFSTLSSPSDTFAMAGLADALLLYQKSNNLYASDSRLSNPVQFLTDSGSQYSANGKATIGFASIPASFMAIASQVSGALPFESPLVCSVDPSDGQVSSWFNSNGIMSKGLLKVDFMAVNNPSITDRLDFVVSAGNAYGGGNYLLVRGIYVTTASTYQGAVYIGWDPSNPSILASTSWPDWPDAMPEAPQPQIAPVDPVIVN